MGSATNRVAVGIAGAIAAADLAAAPTDLMTLEVEGKRAVEACDDLVRPSLLRKGHAATRLALG